jgi:hypothetical protein
VISTEPHATIIERHIAAASNETEELFHQDKIIGDLCFGFFHENESGVTRCRALSGLKIHPVEL